MQLNPENWAKARNILLGNDPERVSVRSAAMAAGVTVVELQKWVRRSRERNIEDEPWIWDICEIYDNARVSQAGTLEDEAWSRSLQGTKEEKYIDGELVEERIKMDNGLLMKMLKARDDTYQDTGKGVDVRVNVQNNISLEDLEAKWVAMGRMKDVKQGALDASLHDKTARSLRYDQGAVLVDKVREIESTLETIPE